ncbi:hypothetical protein K523DRAFT_368331 [Schizophyllum commune Tattone D]|nr:hypothetical protein K523DRAFT_368331 [Schizophyllum commune Tattone D]
MPVTCDEKDSGKRCAQCYRPTVPSSTLLCDQCDESAWLPTLRSGNQPSDAQRATLDAELAALREAADAHKRELGRILARLDTLQPHIDRRVCLLHSPVRRLPDELLAEPKAIRMKSGETADPDLPALLPSRVFAPPHVCSWWRTLTLSRPALRPCIHIPREALMAFDPDSCHAVPERLSRSFASLPYRELDIRVSHSHISPESVVALNRQLLQTHRWRRARLDNLPWRTLEELATSHFPHLQHMHIAMGAEDEWHDTPWIGDGSPAYLWKRRSRTSTFSRCNAFPSYCLDPSYASSCSLLHSLEWWDERDDEAVNVQDVMPVERSDASLRHLAIHHIWAVTIDALENFLKWTNMPNLVDLEVSHVSSNILVPRLEQYGCRLASLTLIVSVCWMSPSAISNILEATPELESLAFVYDSASTQDREEEDEDTEEEDEDTVEEDKDTMEDILQALCDTLTVTGDSKLPPGSRLFPDTCTCVERCFDHFYKCMLRDWPPDERPVRHLKEVRLATPLSPKNIEEVRNTAAELCLEVYGLDTCSAMYDALLPHNWQPPTLTSRKDKPNPPEC